MAKIAFIADPLCSDTPNGIRTYSQKLIRNILFQNSNNEYFLIVPKLVEGLNVEQIITPFLKGPFALERRNLYQLPAVLRKLNPDIVHEFSHFGPFLRQCRFRKIINIYDLIPLLFPETRPNSEITYLRHRWGLPFLLNKTDKIIAISNSTKSDLMKYYNISGDKITVVYCAAEGNFKKLNSQVVKDFKRENGIDFPFILNIGTLEPRKNQEFIINVFLILKEKYQIPHKLIIIGNRDKKHMYMLPKLKKISRGLEVIFKEGVADNDLVGYYNSADLFLFPSLYEGFGLPVLEAMRCGCPVIASDTASISEITAGRTMLLKLDSMPHWAEESFELLSNENIRNNFIVSGLERAEYFSWGKSAKEVLNLYDKII